MSLKEGGMENDSKVYALQQHGLKPLLITVKAGRAGLKWKKRYVKWAVGLWVCSLGGEGWAGGIHLGVMIYGQGCQATALNEPMKSRSWVLACVHQERGEKKESLKFSWLETLITCAQALLPYKVAIEAAIGMVPVTFICSALTRREVVMYSVYTRGRSLEGHLPTTEYDIVTNHASWICIFHKMSLFNNFIELMKWFLGTRCYHQNLIQKKQQWKKLLTLFHIVLYWKDMKDRQQ